MSIDDLEDVEFEVEARFRTAFQRAGRLTPKTPGELLDALVRASAEGAIEPVSVLQRAFYRVRQVLAAELAVPRAAIRPATPLAELLPDRTRRRTQWHQIAARLGARHLPGLTRPVWLERRLVYATSAVAPVALSASMRYLPLGTAVPLTAGLVASLVLLELHLTRRWCTEFEPATLDAGTLARYLAAYGASALELPDDRWTREQLKEILAELLRLECGVVEFDETTAWDDLQPAGARAP